jgi:hypothetical protein
MYVYLKHKKIIKFRLNIVFINDNCINNKIFIVFDNNNNAFIFVRNYKMLKLNNNLFFKIFNCNVFL